MMLRDLLWNAMRKIKQKITSKKNINDVIHHINFNER